VPDFRPIAILLVYLLAVSGVMAFAEYDDFIPGKKVSAIRYEPKVSIEVYSEDTATIEETMTCEIRVSVDNTETTATTVDVSDTISFKDGTLIEVIDARPGFEDTEAVPGGGVKIKWGLFQLVGGEELNIELKLKPRKKGMMTNMASAKMEDGGMVSSKSLVTFIIPPVESTSTTTTAFNNGLSLNKNLPNNIFGKSGKSSKDKLSSGGEGTGFNAATAGKGGSAASGNSTKKQGAKTSGSGPASTGDTAANETKNSTKNNTENTKAIKPSPPNLSGAIKPGNGFSDVDKGDWFKSYVDVLVAQDIIKGYANNTFRPGDTVNRAEFIVFVVRGAGIKGHGAEYFDDVSQDDWFYSAVNSAQNHDLIDGVSEKRFAPLEELTREQAAAMIAKVAKLPVDGDSNEIEGWLQGFSDRDDISSWARPYVAASIKYNLMKGYPDNEFVPAEPITRAEASALIYRLFFEKRSMLIEFPDS